MKRERIIWVLEGAIQALILLFKIAVIGLWTMGLFAGGTVALVCCAIGIIGFIVTMISDGIKDLKAAKTKAARN